jgi:hypothetical protein
VAWAAQEAGSAPIRWISPEPQTLTETPAWPARRSLGESVDTASLVLAPIVGRLGHKVALEGRLTDALTLDANYVRQSDAEIRWHDRQGS